MKHRLSHEYLAPSVFKEMLAGAQIIESREIGGANLYHLTHEGEELVVLTLPAGGALKVAMARVMPPERRLRTAGRT